jgi:hypothetical protein
MSRVTAGSPHPIIVPLTASIHCDVTVEAHMSARRRSTEKVSSGRYAVEEWFGEDLHRDSGEWRNRTRIVDRKNDRYREHIVSPDGTVVRDVEEPLSDHLGRGSARRE